jgi:hypothetical protein
LFDAVKSFEALERTRTAVILAIRYCEDIGKAIEDVVGDLAIPHRAFMIYSGNERRRLLDCLIKPVSEWALGIVISTLDSRGAEAAYKLYMDIEGSPRAASFSGQLWERKVHRYFLSGRDLSFTIQCLEDDDDSTMEWKPFKDMLTFNFRPAKRLAGHLHQCIEANKAGYFRPKSDHFASFDAIIYQPEKPLVNAQITDNRDHDISTRGPKLLQKLLHATDPMSQPLRPLAKKPWIILFIVPTPMHTTFTKQNFKPDALIWRAKTKQYVLGLDKYDVFH